MRRYAIYYAPDPQSDLGELGASWLGWDAALGTPRAQPTFQSIAADMFQEVTRTPRRYGFHGTLKPPFVPVEGAAYRDLSKAILDLATRLQTVTFSGLAIKRIGSFFALVPRNGAENAQAAEGLRDLAATVVEDLDHFRRPPDADELARRRKADLTERQDSLLRRWGYPYVMEEFRFHITLSGPVSDDDLARRFLDEAATHFAPVLDQPFTVDAITLFGDPGADRGDGFKILERIALSGA